MGHRKPLHIYKAKKPASRRFNRAVDAVTFISSCLGILTILLYLAAR